MSSVLRRSGNLSAVQKPTVGDTKTSLVNADHLGWLRCDGRSLSIAAYPQLYKVIGTSFGSTGTGYFNLPNPEGRVLAFVGRPQTQVQDDYVADTNTWVMGDLSGEEIHTLTLGEMPVHNHDFSDLSGTTVAIQGNAFGFTDLSGEHNHTGLTDPSGAHTHTINDSGHSHSYVNNVNNQGTDNAFNTETAADDLDVAGTTGTSTTGITINSVGNHRHGIQFDGEHRHRIRRAGGNQPHNNIQPTIWLGNLFVYCGKLFTGSDGIQAPFSTNKFPFHYPNNNPPIF
jgi:microcystin-dependent protein